MQKRKFKQIVQIPCEPVVNPHDGLVTLSGKEEQASSGCIERGRSSSSHSAPHLVHRLAVNAAMTTCFWSTVCTWLVALRLATMVPWHDRHAVMSIRHLYWHEAHACHVSCSAYRCGQCVECMHSTVVCAGSTQSRSLSPSCTSSPASSASGSLSNVQSCDDATFLHPWHFLATCRPC